MKSLIKRVLALAAVAASCSTAGLLAPATAAADATAASDSPSFIMEATTSPGTVLTQAPSASLILAPYRSALGQTWYFKTPGTDPNFGFLANRYSGDCITRRYDFTVGWAPCDYTSELQVWSRWDNGDGTTSFFWGNFTGCLNGHSGSVYLGSCYDPYDRSHRWRLLPA